eukprot:366537-Chlamydomonas_euryale.AAC.17
MACRRGVALAHCDVDSASLRQADIKQARLRRRRHSNTLSTCRTVPCRVKGRGTLCDAFLSNLSRPNEKHAWSCHMPHLHSSLLGKLRPVIAHNMPHPLEQPAERHLFEAQPWQTSHPAGNPHAKTLQPKTAHQPVACVAAAVCQGAHPSPPSRQPPRKDTTTKDRAPACRMRSCCRLPGCTPIHGCCCPRGHLCYCGRCRGRLSRAACPSAGPAAQPEPRL